MGVCRYLILSDNRGKSTELPSKRKWNNSE